MIDRNFSLNNAFGASRKNRIINLELHRIIDKIHSDSIKYRSDKFSKIEDLKKNIINKGAVFQLINMNHKHTPSLKNGKYLIIIQEQLPWTLINKTSDHYTNFKTYAIEIIKK